MTSAPKPDKTCFVIQKFDDGGVFDTRYIETIKPSIEKAGVTPVRADDILGTKPIIRKIERAIKDATICLAEVSTSNENVWLELGYALALDRPCIILCDKALRNNLPFDIQHRPTIFYRTETRSGFDKLEQEIIENIKTELAKDAGTLSKIKVTAPTSSDEMQEYEMGIVKVLLANGFASPEGVGTWRIEKELAQQGYSAEAMGLGLAALMRASLVTQSTAVGIDSDPYYTYRLSESGLEWVTSQKANLRLSEPKKTDDTLDDEIPF